MVYLDQNLTLEIRREKKASIAASHSAPFAPGLS